MYRRSIALLMVSTGLMAGPGDSVPSGDSPSRRPDGSAFLPKTSQRQLQIRTVVVRPESLPKTFELEGRVASDAASGGKVQPTQAGRLEPGPKGMPTLGAKVRAGEVLVYVRPTENAAPELRTNFEAARRKLARLEQLEGAVPRRDIEAARLEVESLGQRLSPGGGALVTREPLVAPVSGVIASTNAVAGQVVEPRELLYEIVDPSRLVVEAQLFDASLAESIGEATAATADGSRVRLTLAGVGRSLKDGALPALFKATKEGAGPALSVGQPVKIVVETKDRVQGQAVPAAALAKNPSNLDIVWVHTTPEEFEPRVVRWGRLDGERVVILDGLRQGDRVVARGANLLNQVR